MRHTAFNSLGIYYLYKIQADSWHFNTFVFKHNKNEEEVVEEEQQHATNETEI